MIMEMYSRGTGKKGEKGNKPLGVITPAFLSKAPKGEKVSDEKKATALILLAPICLGLYEPLKAIVGSDGSNKKPLYENRSFSQ